MPVYLVWRDEFLTIDYPIVDGIGRTMLFYLKSEQMSISDGIQISLTPVPAGKLGEVLCCDPLFISK